MHTVGRRQFLLQSLATAAAVHGGSLLAAGQVDGDRAEAASLYTPEATRAVERGLAYLDARQHEDGSFGSGAYRSNAAVCGLCGMAFMAAGSTPGRGPYGRQVTECAQFLLDHAMDSGFIVVEGAVSHGPMYGHGFATLFLAEAYGMAMLPGMREKLGRAVELIIQTQNPEGGWRYHPHSRDADISVTICQVMALRAARNAGIFVPNETIDRCIDYVKRCQNPDGGFMYMLEDGPSLFPRSAAGVVALYSAGVYEGPEIENALAYLMQFVPKEGSVNNDGHFFYGHYYAVQAMWQAGGRRWQTWYPAIRDVLLDQQRDEDGSWSDLICSEYGTAMACLILQMPSNYLPIFQR
jgi:hypothetical protein